MSCLEEVFLDPLEERLFYLKKKEYYIVVKLKNVESRTLSGLLDIHYHFQHPLNDEKPVDTKPNDEADIKVRVMGKEAHVTQTEGRWNQMEKRRTYKEPKIF